MAFQLFANRGPPRGVNAKIEKQSSARPWDAQKLEALEQWVGAHHALPLQSSADESERKLATFANAMRRYHRRKGLSPELVQRLRSMRGMPAEAWRPGWVAQCRDLAGWMADRHRAPSRSAEDPREKRLAVTLSHGQQAHRNAALPADLLTRLRNLNGSTSQDAPASASAWGSAAAAMDARRERLKELGDWIEGHSRLPKQSAVEVCERRLARFLAAMHRQYKLRKLSPEEQQLLEALPGVPDRLEWGRELAANPELASSGRGRGRGRGRGQRKGAKAGRGTHAGRAKGG
eukprot:TRINITY_DN47551_c0_g1_i1.p1 TRINITY_DN47551_c0_g1~~TRINITY_DN47551_c0_g1_i1.p1  ORF type:complete len:290 (-),score=40.71 TRINITY_DN47551_c0_g1_i1:103-972(-)